MSDKDKMKVLELEHLLTEQVVNLIKAINLSTEILLEEAKYQETNCIPPNLEIFKWSIINGTEKARERILKLMDEFDKNLPELEQ